VIVRSIHLSSFAPFLSAELVSSKLDLEESKIAKPLADRHFYRQIFWDRGWITAHTDAHPEVTQK
jgi:hypothetical protein